MSVLVSGYLKTSLVEIASAVERMVLPGDPNIEKDQVNDAENLRRIPLNVRAISAKNICQKTAHSTITFSMLFETSHFNSLLQVTP